MIRPCDWSPMNGYTYFIRGNARADLGQYKEAIFDFDQTLRLQPYFVGAYVNRGPGQNRTRSIPAGDRRL